MDTVLQMAKCFREADILLPNFSDSRDYEKWAVIACDQFTSEPEYWQQVARRVGDHPSTLHIILPEIYLAEGDARLAGIYNHMKQYAESLLCEHKGALLYVERTLASGRVRRGLVGMVDLEDYDYRPGTTPLIRATEGTVVDRIPPRVRIRRGAQIEAPHVMMLIDDPEKTVIEEQAKRADSLKIAYDFDLMLGGGHIKGRFLDRQGITEVASALEALGTPLAMEKKYGLSCTDPLLFAVGDGNHSLASAKAFYEEIKAELGEGAKSHPARYALAEIVNLHDDSLEFEPIYRVLFNANSEDVIKALRRYVDGDGKSTTQSVRCITAEGEVDIPFGRETHTLTVGTLQHFIDDYLSDHPEVEVDYIHGEDSLRSLAKKENAIGFLFDGMSKNELFPSVIKDGVLPRKTFSMGEARDKRYYLECRKIIR